MKVIYRAILAILLFMVFQGIGGIMAYAGQSICGQSPSSAMALGLIISGLTTIGILYALRIISTQTFLPHAISWGHASIAFTASLLGIFAMDLLSEQLHLPDLTMIEIAEMARSPLGIIAIALVSPIVEELVFREAIIRTMLNQGCSIWAAILFSALSFGIIHFNPAQIPFAFVMGIILGIIYVRTRSVLLTVLIHIVNNGLAVIEINVLGERINELSYSEVMGGNALAWTCIIVSATLCIAFLLQFWKIDDCKLK